MTTQSLRLKITSPSIKLKSLPRYGATLLGNTGISITNHAGVLTAALALLQFPITAQFDPTLEYVPIVDANGNYQLVTVASLLNNLVTTIRIVFEAGDIAVGNNTQLLIMNRTADEAPSNIILPLSSAKVGKIKIVDFKGNASAFPHTIKTSGADTFQGAVTQWKLAADGASVTLDPIPLAGYAV